MKAIALALRHEQVKTRCWCRQDRPPPSDSPRAFCGAQEGAVAVGMQKGELASLFPQCVASSPGQGFEFLSQHSVGSLAQRC